MYDFAIPTTYYPSTFEWYMYTSGYNQLYPTILGQDIGIWCDTVQYASYFQNGCIHTKIELTGSVGCNGLSASTNPTPAQCGNCADGWISCTPSGGTSPYTFTWSTIPVQTTPVSYTHLTLPTIYS